MSRDHVIEKIGGTSISDTRAALDNVLIGRRRGSEIYGRIVVVSAYAGVTDHLLEHKRDGRPGVYTLFANGEAGDDWRQRLDDTADTLKKINARIFPDQPELRSKADGFVAERIAGARDCLRDLRSLCSYGHFDLAAQLSTVREMLASIGEAHSAFNTTLMLNLLGVRARFVDLTGWRADPDLTLDGRIEGGLNGIELAEELPIVTGYAHCRDGMVRRFGRGYTEVTFSRIAILTAAREAIIHKEFHLSSADPRLIGPERVRTIGRTNYDVADQLANLGMEAIHPHAAKGLRQAQIPLRVRNTFDPQDAGTVIRRDYVSDAPRVEMVTGTRGVVALEFFEPDMVGVKGYDAAILTALQRYQLRIITKVSNANTIVHYLQASRDALQRVISALREEFPSADVTTTDVAIAATIGSDLRMPGLLARASRALHKSGIDVLGVHEPLRKVDVMFIVAPASLDSAVRALHREFVERDLDLAKRRAAA
ncbi:MAG: aspartate kinase [Steroidobacteraceae bacterium]